MSIRPNSMIGVAALALTLGLSGGAWAQQAQPRQQQPASPAQSQSQQPSQRAVEGAQRATEQTQQLATQGRKLVGKDIYGANNEKIGDVKDVVMDQSSNQVTAVVADIGGFLGIGSKTVAIPINQLRAEGDDRIVATGLTKQQAENLPEFEEQRDRSRQQQTPQRNNQMDQQQNRTVR